jgi:peptidyl-prolyl cis-trans isomerase B (cyclophilin B)
MILLKTNYGDITLELNQEKAPATCENFERYVKDGFFDGTLFHRVIPDFMIQGGGLESGMHQKKTHPAIKNEADNGLQNKMGAIAMARTSDPHSATAQFFINVKDNDFLDYKSSTQDGWGYCVFGEVTDGLDVVMKIAQLPTTTRGMHQIFPLEDVILKKAEVTE